MSCLMFDGKRSVAEKIVYGAPIVFKKSGNEPVKVFHDALENVSRTWKFALAVSAALLIRCRLVRANVRKRWRSGG